MKLASKPGDRYFGEHSMLLRLDDPHVSLPAVADPNPVFDSEFHRFDLIN